MLLVEGSTSVVNGTAVSSIEDCKNVDYSTVDLDSDRTVQRAIEEEQEFKKTLQRTCELCGEESKYKCPGCATPTCSIRCIKQHKTLSGCSGVRRKLKYVPLDKFTELNLLQDFRILESATAQVDKCRRDKLKRHTNQGTDVFCAPRMPKSLKKLQFEASRFGTRIRYLPPHFHRRKNNSSCFDYKTKTLSWHIELHLPSVTKQLNIPSVPDRTKLWRLLAPIIESPAGPLNISTKGLEQLTDDDIDLYRSAGYAGLCVYLKCQGLLRNSHQSHNHRREGGDEVTSNKHPRFYSLDMKRSLRHNLRGKVLVEYPVIYLIMKGEECNYREEADCFSPEDSSTASIDKAAVTYAGMDIEEKTSIGMIPGSKEGMEASTEIYKQYFDFYLDYYTHKYHHQPPTNAARPSSSELLPSAFEHVKIQVQPPPSQDELTLKHQQQHGYNKASPATRSNNHATSQVVSKSPAISWCSPPTHSAVFNDYADMNINKSNMENARKLQMEIRAESKSAGLLGGLVAYDDSDSDQCD